jgi:hypothetical protein
MPSWWDDFSGGAAPHKEWAAVRNVLRTKRLYGLGTASRGHGRVQLCQECFQIEPMLFGGKGE